MSDYPAFAKIPRLHKPVVITEKIDGTNALIEIVQTVYADRISYDDGDLLPVRYEGDFTYVESPADQQTYRVRAGSRTRWIGAASGDNYGFAAWVRENAAELTALGPGLHYGEWYGLGINRNYGLTEKRFALFNVDRWGGTRPECCDVVPLLDRCDGADLSATVEYWTGQLAGFGSRVANFSKPEGLVVYHQAARQYFKVIFGSDAPKSLTA